MHRRHGCCVSFLSGRRNWIWVSSVHRLSLSQFDSACDSVKRPPYKKNIKSKLSRSIMMIIWRIHFFNFYRCARLRWISVRWMGCKCREKGFIRPSRWLCFTLRFVSKNDTSFPTKTKSEKQRNHQWIITRRQTNEGKMSPEMVIYFLLLLIEMICQTAASANRLNDIYWNSTNPM